MKKGKVKFYNESKGFGFIIPEEGGKEIFVHATGLGKNVEISEGMQVSYDLTEGRKGPNAINVKPV